LVAALLRWDLRDLRGECPVSFLVAASPRWDLCGENSVSFVFAGW
jgi:hypothetical protein